MPMIGFLPIPAGEDPLAGFPSSGLVGLYKCDEYDGDRCYDATGNLPPIVFSTGVALDCTTNAQYVLDGTGFAASLADLTADIVFAAEFITPALVLSGTAHHLIAGTLLTNSPIRCYLTESNGYGSEENRFSFTADFRVKDSGANVTTMSTGTSTSNFRGLSPSTHYQVVVKLKTSGGGAPAFELRIRSGTTAPTTTIKSSPDIADTYTIVYTSSIPVRIGTRGTSTGPFKGKLLNLFVAQGDIDIEDAWNALLRPSPTFAQSALGTTARYWSFCDGTGTTCHELITGAAPAITGTQTWATGLSGCTQTCLRQGVHYYGKAGVRLGGEDGFVPVGAGGLSEATAAPFLSSGDGWTVICTMRTGNHLPAADQLLLSVYGPDGTGTVATALNEIPGVHLSHTTGGGINLYYKRLGTGNDSGTGVSAGSVGDGDGRVSHGLLTTYAITCTSAGVVSCVKMDLADSAPETVYTGSAAAGNVNMRSVIVKLGTAAFDSDLIAGFIGFYHRPLTAAEVAQCHRSATSRMVGTPIYVDSTLAEGNGTELFPYTTIISATRTLQRGQTVYVAGGDYDRLNIFGSGAVASAPSWTGGATYIATGAVAITNSDQTPDSTEADYPLTIDHTGVWKFLTDGGTWSIDAESFFSGACIVSEDCDEFQIDDATFANAVQSNAGNGTGCAIRAKIVRINDCVSNDNEEHGIYLRLIGEGAADQTAYVRGLTCSGNGEDGLKMTAEGAYGAIWADCVIDGITVDGGKNQLNLRGVSGKVSNILLTGKTDTGTTTSAAFLGSPDAYAGEVLESRYSFTGSVSNMTIVDALVSAVWVRGASDVVLSNVLCSGCASDFTSDGTGTVTTQTCAGDASTGEWPDENGNIPGATITFTDAGSGDYTLDSGSDGYGDGTNLTGLSDEVESDLAGDPRPTTGAWNIGAY